MKYEVRVSNIPDGCYAEHYLCGPSNGDGNPDKAKRVFDTREQAQRVVDEFYQASCNFRDDFIDMDAWIVEVEEVSRG